MPGERVRNYNRANMDLPSWRQNSDYYEKQQNFEFKVKEAKSLNSRNKIIMPEVMG